jgi:hypothetical protein
VIVAKLLSRDVAFVGAPTTQRVPFILAELGGEDPLRRLFPQEKGAGFVADAGRCRLGGVRQELHMVCCDLHMC